MQHYTLVDSPVSIIWSLIQHHIVYSLDILPKSSLGIYFYHFVLGVCCVQRFCAAKLSRVV